MTTSTTGLPVLDDLTTRLDVDQALAAVPAGRVDPCDGCGQGVCACHEGK